MRAYPLLAFYCRTSQGLKILKVGYIIEVVGRGLLPLLFLGVCGMSRKKIPYRDYYNTDKTFDDRVLSIAEEISSQFKGDAYDQLKETGRLELFKRLLSTAAVMGYSLNQTCGYINKFMKDSFKGKNGITFGCLKLMIQRYPDINAIWAINRDNIAALAASKIYSLIDKTEDIELLLKVAKEFDNSGIVHDKNRADFVPTQKIIRVNLGDAIPGDAKSKSSGDSPETLASLEQLRAGIEQMKKTEAVESVGDGQSIDLGDGGDGLDGDD